MLDRLTERMKSRSAALVLTIDDRLDRILQLWLLLAGLVAAARIALTRIQSGGADISTLTSYMLVVLAPFVSTLLALHWFADGDRLPQPLTRLATIGSWRTVDAAEARRHPLYGCNGIMLSLLIGIMVNVPIRAAEYFAAMPPLPEAAPAWLSALHFALTFDAVLFGSLYMIAFVAALRRVPLFPRLLVAIWVGDLAMQLIIAQLVTNAGGLPPSVAIALYHLLHGNVLKVLVGTALWLPYLILSTRVNVTYRHRTPLH